MQSTAKETGLQSRRVIRDLRELQELTGNADGAQRVCWTPPWDRARAWMREKLSALPVQVETDPAGNLWATLPGNSPVEVWLGGHMDSVPDGGWLDGCLNWVAGLEVLRRLAATDRPAVTVSLVDWADEEGRFGPSLYGSSAVAGAFNPALFAGRADRLGVTLPEALAAHGLDLNRVPQAHSRLDRAAAYLELHIEQGPVLERQGQALGVVLGAMGVERHALRFRGQAAHAGSTPMNMRQDALRAGARFSLEVSEIATRRGGVGTVGRFSVQPGIPTAVPGRCDLALDQRHMDVLALAGMLREAQDASRQIAAEEGVEVEWEQIYAIPPALFHPELIHLCETAVQEIGEQVFRLPSGPLHDAVSMSHAGVPTAMLFVQSLGGLSHTRKEDTLEAHLEAAVVGFDRLVEKTLAWAAAQAR